MDALESGCAEMVGGAAERDRASDLRKAGIEHIEQRRVLDGE